MESYLNYSSEYFYFFGSVVLAALMVLGFFIYRPKKKKALKAGILFVSVVVVSNTLYFLTNLSLNGVPNSTADSWSTLWLFVFLPSSFILALAFEACVNHARAATEK